MPKNVEAVLTSAHDVEAVLTSTHDLCFEQKYENIRIFLSENFHFLMVRFSVYLNRHIFVIRSDSNEYLKHMFSLRNFINIFVDNVPYLAV